MIAAVIAARPRIERCRASAAFGSSRGRARHIGPRWNSCRKSRLIANPITRQKGRSFNFSVQAATASNRAFPRWHTLRAMPMHRTRHLSR